MNRGVFSDGLKPIYKKESRNEKENYRPVYILPNLSKIFKCCICLISLMITLIRYCRNISTALEKGLAA